MLSLALARLIGVLAVALRLQLVEMAEPAGKSPKVHLC